MADAGLFLVCNPRGGVVVQLTRRRGRLYLSDSDAVVLEALLQARHRPKGPAGTTVVLAEVAAPSGELAATAWSVTPTAGGIELTLYPQGATSGMVKRVVSPASASDLAEALLRATGPAVSGSQLPDRASPAPAGAGKRPQQSAAPKA